MEWIRTNPIRCIPVNLAAPDVEPVFASGMQRSCSRAIRTETQFLGMMGTGIYRITLLHPSAIDYPEYWERGLEPNMTYRKVLFCGIFLAVFLIAPVVSLAQVAWVKDFNAALRQAEREKKFIVLDLSASW